MDEAHDRTADEIEITFDAGRSELGIELTEQTLEVGRESGPKLIRERRSSRR